MQTPSRRHSGLVNPDGVLSNNEAHSESLEEKAEQGDETRYVSGLKLNLIVTGLTLSVLLVALDNAILATAIPTITTAFNSLHDVGWYGSAFLITICALQPISGKLYQHFSLKWTYLSFLGLFELGSLLCGVATSSTMLVVGRAVAGMGAAGLFSGALTIIAHAIPLRLRPIYIGIIASSMQIANVLGPLIGGVLTQRVSWRWCFFINLPAGAATALLLVFFFHPGERENSKLSFTQKLQYLDLPGFLMFVPAVIMLLLAVQWGGTKYSWNSGTVIGLLCGFAGMLAVFGIWQWRQQDMASIPPKILLNRNILSSSMIGFLLLGAMQLMTYFLPIWFQAIKGASPTESGIMFLPVVISTMISTFMAGGLVTRLGYFNPGLFFGTTLLAIGAGVLSLLRTDSGSQQWIGYQIIFGLGVGTALPMTLIAVMAVLPQNAISIGNSIVVFFQFLGGAIFLATAESLFASQLAQELSIYAPTVDVQAIIAAGAAAVATAVSPEMLPAVLEAYSAAITTTYYVAAAGGAAAFIASFGMQWVSVKGKSLMSAGAA